MALSGISLNAATAIGPGAAISFDRPRSKFSAQVDFSGTPNPGSPTSVVLESSLDGVNWIACGSASFPAFVPSFISPLSAFSHLTPALHLRCNLVSLDSGTTSVTATVAAD